MTTFAVPFATVPHKIFKPMEKMELRRRTNELAMLSAFSLGLLFCLRFVLGVVEDRSWVAFLYGIVWALVPVIAFRNLYVFGVRTKVELQQQPSFGGLLKFCVLQFLYASLWLSLVQFLVYRYWKTTLLAETYDKALALLRVMAANRPSLQVYVDQAAQVGVPTPLQVAVQAIWGQMLAGLLFGLCCVPLVRLLLKRIQITG